mgnify:CR=1 FL=1
MPLRNIWISSPPQARKFYDFNVSLPFLACFHLVDTYKNPPKKNTILANIFSFLTRIFSFSFKMTSIFLFIFLFKMTGIFSLFFSGLPNQSASRCRVKTNKRVPLCTFYKLKARPKQSSSDYCLMIHAGSLGAQQFGSRVR